MKKKLFSLCMATAIAICGAASVSAADGWMQETEMNAGDHSLTMVLWEDTYDSLVEAMSASDITIVGTVTSQSVEVRDEVYFTHSYVEAPDGEIYDVLQTGAMIGGNEVGVPYDAPLLEIGKEYFLSIYQTDYDELYGQYYLISGGSQGYGEFDSETMSVAAVSESHRSLFSSFSLSESNINLSDISVASVDVNSIVETYSEPVLPLDYMVWDIWNGVLPKYWVTIGNIHVTSDIYPAIEDGAASWSGEYPGLYVRKASSRSTANVDIYLSRMGDTGIIGTTTPYVDGDLYAGADRYDVIVGADIELNADTSHAFTADFWQSITCHEMGHALSLMHNGGGGNNPRAIMNPDYKLFADTWKLTEPQTEDVRKLEEKYGKEYY